jgi:hypothetical protein
MSVVICHSALARGDQRRSEIVTKGISYRYAFFIVFALAAVLDDGSRSEQRTTGYAGEFKML